MKPRCAADVTRGKPRRCTKSGHHPAVVQPTTDVPAPQPELVCTWHRDVVVPARRPDPSCCPCCGRPL